jgi:hypothetical protein
MDYEKEGVTFRVIDISVSNVVEQATMTNPSSIILP